MNTYYLIMIFSNHDLFISLVSEITMPWGVLYITSGGRRDQRVCRRAILTMLLART